MAKAGSPSTHTTQNTYQYSTGHAFNTYYSNPVPSTQRHKHYVITQYAYQRQKAQRKRTHSRSNTGRRIAACLLPRTTKSGTNAQRTGLRQSGWGSGKSPRASFPRVSSPLAEKSSGLVVSLVVLARSGGGPAATGAFVPQVHFGAGMQPHHRGDLPQLNLYRASLKDRAQDGE